MSKTLTTNQSTGFKKKLVATAVASAMAAGFSGIAIAQQDEGAVEEVVVTGIRASLQRSMDMKRDSQGVVDAISAEDIGKFPDTNLAESLQRITGVSISRENGEGSKVTVRGLGPDFNLITLNGRQMPGATLDATSASGSRSFDFANIASEGVSAVEVYKTSRADVSSGGIGATINIVTPKPLKMEPTASVGIKGVLDDSSDSSELTPEVSGIYSGQFADGMFGVAVTGSYQERNGGAASANIGTGWRTFPGTVVQDWGGQEKVDWEWGGIGFGGGAHQNQPDATDVYSTPQSVSYGFSQFERTRTNAQLTLQFAPTENLTSTLDYTYSENEIKEEYSDIGAWFNFGGQSTIFTDLPSPAAQTPLLYSEDMSGGDLAMATGRQSRLYENDSIGLNVEWKPVDPLTLTFDAHHSVAEASPSGQFGNSAGIAVSAYVRDRTTVNMKGDMPVMILDILNGAGGTNLREEDLRVSGSYFRNSQMKHEIDQVQIGGTWEFNEELSAKFGIARTEGDYRSAFSNVQRDTWGGLGTTGDVAGQGIFTMETIQNYFSGSKGSTSAEEIAFLGGTNNQPMNERFVADFDKLREFASANYDDGTGTGTCTAEGSYYCAKAPDTFNSITEDTDSAFVQLNYKTDTFTLGAGLRYESTDVSTPATAQAYGPVTWNAANELSMAKVGDPVAITDTGSYDYFLPSIDASWRVEDNVVIRASYGESIARAGWLDLRGGTSYNELVRPQGGTASAGNPGLKPYKADNFDFSAEWYYDDASYVSAGFFMKKVENFISSRTVTSEGPLEGVYHPNSGPRQQAAVASGIAPNDSVAIRQYIYDNFADPESAYIDGSGNIIIVGVPGDSLANFEVTEVSNGDKTVWVDGMEFAVQHNFGETGFGVIANYTMVNASTDFDNLTINEPQFAITGVSDTANLVGFYDRDGLQVRVAYNWRDSFLASTASGTGNNPINVDEYSQIDINVSYQLTDNLSVFLEGLNVTEESGRNFGRSNYQTLGYFEGSARYNIGARYSF